MLHLCSSTLFSFVCVSRSERAPACLCRDAQERFDQRNGRYEPSETRNKFDLQVLSGDQSSGPAFKRPVLQGAACKGCRQWQRRLAQTSRCALTRLAVPQEQGRSLDVLYCPYLLSCTLRCTATGSISSTVW